MSAQSQKLSQLEQYLYLFLSCLYYWLRAGIWPLSIQIFIIHSLFHHFFFPFPFGGTSNDLINESSQHLLAQGQQWKHQHAWSPIASFVILVSLLLNFEHSGNFVQTLNIVLVFPLLTLSKRKWRLWRSL